MNTIQKRCYYQYYVYTESCVRLTLHYFVQYNIIVSFRDNYNIILCKVHNTTEIDY